MRRCAKPILDQLCRRLEHVGPVGNGALAKFTINMPLMIYYQALGEALAMARPIGLEPERLMDIICDTSGAPTMMKARGPMVAKMMKGEDPPVTFDLAGCVKDLQSMQAEGKARGHHAAAGADDARLHGGVGYRRGSARRKPRACGVLGEENRRAVMSVTLAQASTIVDAALKKGRETNLRAA